MEFGSLTHTPNLYWPLAAAVASKESVAVVLNAPWLTQPPPGESTQNSNRAPVQPAAVAVIVTVPDAVGEPGAAEMAAVGQFASNTWVAMAYVSYAMGEPVCFAHTPIW